MLPALRTILRAKGKGELLKKLPRGERIIFNTFVYGLIMCAIYYSLLNLIIVVKLVFSI